MKLQDGDSVHGRFTSPSGLEIKSFDGEHPLPPESEVKVQYHGSLELLAKVLGSFDAQKKEIMKSIKFEGAILFSNFENLDLYFSLWIMTKLDSSRNSIRLELSEEVAIRDRDVGKVLGIPWYGKEIIVQNNSSSETMSKIASIFRQADSKSNLTMSHVENVLSKRYHSKMTNQEVDAFKVAVVIFLMSSFLATGGNKREIPLGLLKYLTDPSEIHLFNWALLVRRYLFSWSHFVNQQLKLNRQTVTIGGCIILPMVIYFENKDIGMGSLLHPKLNVNSFFNTRNFKLLIAVDTTICSVSNARYFGTSKVRPANKVRYGRMLIQTILEDEDNKNKRKFSNSSTEIPDRMKFAKGMAAKLLLLAANRGSSKEIISSTGLFKKQSSPNDGAIRASNAEPTIYTMRTFIEDAKINDNSNWSKYSEFYDWVHKGPAVQKHKLWFHHKTPYCIKIDGTSICEQLVEGCRYGYSVCDAIIRDQVTSEDIVFKADLKRERHILPASFMAVSREGNRIKDIQKLRVFFLGGQVKYNISECIQINLPVSIRRMWSCYSWNLKDKTLTVLDPLLMNGSTEAIKKRHEDLVLEISDVLISCFETFFPSYDFQASKWKTIYRNDISDKCRWCDTGLYSLHYAFYFDTDGLTEEISWEDDFMGRWRSLWRILAMPGNVGDKPDMFYEIEEGEEE